ncbi:MAG: hypothetical protein LRY50_12650 [Geovibrio sp.]|nr:hypothetical protein [Geovibrio sp.]
MKTGTAAKIRELANKQPFFTSEDFRSEYGVGERIFWSAVNDFVKRGELVKTSNGFMKNTEYRQKRRGYVICQIAKAMRVCRTFTVDEIVMLTNADASQVRRFLRECRKKNLISIEYIQPEGRKSCPIPVYRVTDSDRFKKEAL